MFKIKLGGIYSIQHKPSGKLYIGSSVNFTQRWASHITLLVMNKHHSPELQQLWNGGSPEDFTFEIIKYVSKTTLKKESGLKGMEFEKYYKRYLLDIEKEVMGCYDVKMCLNKNKGAFNGKD